MLGMELLFACAVLLGAGSMSEAEYGKVLDSVFLRNPNQDILLELEWHSSDIKRSISLIRAYCAEHEKDLKDTALGCFLFDRLKSRYLAPGADLHTFCGELYRVWSLLPQRLQTAQPFHTMSYADEPLSWGDEAQTRRLCEYILHYYDDVSEGK